MLVVVVVVNVGVVVLGGTVVVVVVVTVLRDACKNYPALVSHVLILHYTRVTN